MCIIAVKPKGLVLSRECLFNCYSANRDGAGFAYHDEESGTTNIIKGFWDFEKFIEMYEPHKAKATIVHFRIATHRAINGKNCHPWRVNDSLVFAHNGCISGMSEDSELSDTGNFNNSILKPLFDDFPEFYLTEQFKWMMENAIGAGNKLAFMDSQGRQVIVNESKGKSDCGVWFSNHTYNSHKKDFTVLAKEKSESEKEDLPAATEPETATSDSTAQTDFIPRGPALSQQNSQSSLPESELSKLEAALAEKGLIVVVGSLEEADSTLSRLNSVKTSLVGS